MRNDDPLLVVIDVQRVFLEGSPWRIEALPGRLPNIVALARDRSPDVVFTRHVPAPDGGSGTWRDFYRAWSEVGRDPSVWDLVPQLTGIPGVDATKSIYSAFGASELHDELSKRASQGLVLCGVETDCCVLATVLEAIDRGLPVSVVHDAVASPDQTAHVGALAICRRLGEQVELVSTAEVLERSR